MQMRNVVDSILFEYFSCTLCALKKENTKKAKICKDPRCSVQD